MSPENDLRAPFPYFGGKSRVAGLVWDRLGNVPNYIEPFFGSGAVLLARPHPPQTETINDIDCLLANFWRALKCDPDAVAYYADSPVNEADQHARHLWLCTREEFRERMKTDPDYYDPKIAGWWVWGQSMWIGSGWCAQQLTGDESIGARRIPHISDGGTGVHRQLPSVRSMGVHRNRYGIHRKLPNIGDAGRGINRANLTLFPDVAEFDGFTSGTCSHAQITAYLRRLAERLRRVRVCCGDWSRICGHSPTVHVGNITGVFLDPPYSDQSGRGNAVYAADDMNVAHDAAVWAIENGDNPQLRIALCGYDGEHAMPSSWDCVKWKANGGYGNQGNDTGRENAGRERIWFSPHCLQPPSLFAAESFDETALRI